MLSNALSVVTSTTYTFQRFKNSGEN